MPSSLITSTVDLFTTRLETLENLLRSGAEHFSEASEDFLALRLAPDMLPLGTQITFTCNQPRNFALWLKCDTPDDLDPNVGTLEVAYGYIAETKKLLASCLVCDEPPQGKHLNFGSDLHAAFTAHQYVSDFLIPNFYFHLVTTYAILRMAGVPLGKREYMAHLRPFVRHSAS